MSFISSEETRIVMKFTQTHEIDKVYKMICMMIKNSTIKVTTKIMKKG